MIPAKKLTLKDRSTPPADASRRRFAFKSATRNAPPFNKVESPAPGSAADPTISGGYVAVRGTGGTSDLAFVMLDPARWSRSGTTYTYKADSTAAITRIVVKPDNLTVKGGRSLFDYSLDEPAQGRVTVEVKLGTSINGRLYCAEAPAKLSGNPPTTTRNDRVDKFVGQPNALATVCP
jgi:hypothetical protein